MYEIGQQVIYGTHGVCTISAIESMRVGNTTSDFYVLQPIGQPDSKYYIPLQNQAALAKVRPLLSRQELLALIHSDAVRQDVWVADENQRKLRFRQILSQGEHSLILSMIYCLHKHKITQQSLGRKLHISDESFLKDAEKLMNAEFSQILGMASSQIGPFILREMELSEPNGMSEG